MSASQAIAHLLQAVPLEVSKHFELSIVGLNVLLKRDIKFIRPAIGQKRVHHLRKKTSSMISISGIKIAAIVMSALANMRQKISTVANVRPIGQIRQNTGNPKIAVESNAPPST